MFHILGRHTGVLAALLTLLTASSIALCTLAALNIVPSEAFAGTLAATAVAWLAASHRTVVHHVTTHNRRSDHKLEKRLTDTLNGELAALRGEIRDLRKVADDQHVADLMSSVDPDQDNIRRLR